MNELTLNEQARLNECEAVIERGLKTFVEVGNALLAIREAKLYRLDYETFEEYCQERWGFTNEYARLNMRAAEVVKRIQETPTMVGVLPTTESQARPLTQLEPEEQAVAWQRVVESAPNGKVTAAHVISVAKEFMAERNAERRQERVEKIVAISSGNTELVAEKCYPIVYADPPWQYEHSMTDSRMIENHYPTMGLDQICAMPVSEIVTPDAVLFLWTTSPKLAESMRVIEAWGFNYRSCIVWDKERIGMGYYARQQHELLLIAARGSLPVPEPSNRPASVQRLRRGNEHSRKPDEFYELIESMYPEYEKIELFARNSRAGWSAWGNQAC